MVPFAGYQMPLQFAGIMEEHLHTRRAASLFDVSHMGQVRIDGAHAATAIEALVAGDIEALAEGRVRYTVLTNDAGGIIDDLMVTRRPGHLFVVVNAACKDQDTAHIKAGLPKANGVTVLDDRALLALQGPKAAAVLARFAPPVRHLGFMAAADISIGPHHCLITRCGYTGEDGFEISINTDEAEDMAQLLLGEDGVRPAGLGARDSLRLEAGLCLYGADIDATTSPIEAGLQWAISKRRRGGGGFPGAARIQAELQNGPARRLVGLKPEGRAPARAQSEIQDSNGNAVGVVTSGGFGPTVGGPVAMGYVAAAQAAPGTALNLIVRGRPLPALVVKLPFVEHRYFKA